MFPILLALLSAPSLAQDGGDDEFDFIKPDDAGEEDKVESDDFNLFSDEEEFEIAPPVAMPKSTTPVASGLPAVSGDPLAGSYAAKLTATEAGAIVELPILVSVAALEEAFWLKVTAWSGDTQVGESWKHVGPATVPADGPGFTFVKMHVPSAGVELRVSRANAPGEDSEELFRKTVAE